VSRLTGPRVKILRALETQLPGLSRKSAEKRPFGPGQHGPTKRKKAGSPYALRLREKQKVRFNYGLTERALRRVVGEALRSKDNTGQVIIQLLERRLDNVLFRAGFAATIPAAKQLATHGHVLVNGRRETIPSRRLVRGDVISIRPQSRQIAERALESGAGAQSPWLDIDKDALVAKMTGYPDESFLPFELSPRLIIEHYSRVL
jgi:small subunit ribosomal protein S4